MLEVMFWVMGVLIALLVPTCIDLAKRLVKLEDKLRFSNRAHRDVIMDLQRELDATKTKAQENQWMYERECEAHAETQRHLDYWTGACTRAWDKLEDLCKTCEHTCKANEDCLGNDGVDYMRVCEDFTLEEMGL